MKLLVAIDFSEITKLILEKAKYWLEPEIELANYHRFDKKQLNKLLKLVEDRKDEIIENWDEYFNN